tara:strand:- start:960 stop:1112 length:153 start_codon:yes stop_codon:yes gene_type:complete
MNKIDYKTIREILIENSHEDLREVFMNMSDKQVLEELQDTLPYYEIPIIN